MTLDIGQFQLKNRPSRQEWETPPFWMGICDAFLPMTDVDEFFGMEPSRNIAFTGPIGTGKTTAALYMAGSLMDRGYQLFMVSGMDFAGWDERDVQRGLQMLLVDPPEALSSGKCVIIKYPNQGGKADIIYFALNRFLHGEASDHPVVLILVAEDLNSCPTIQENFFELSFHLPDDQEREQYLRNELFSNFTFAERKSGAEDGDMESAKKDEEVLRRLVDETDGLNYLQLSNLEFACRLAKKRELQKKFRFEEKEIMSFLAGMSEDVKQYISTDELDKIAVFFSAAQKRSLTLKELGHQPHVETIRKKEVNAHPDEELFHDEEDIDNITWKEMLRAVGIIM